MKRHAYLAIIVTTLVALQCGSYTKDRLPQLELKVGDEYQNLWPRPVTTKEPDKLCPPSLVAVSPTECCPQGTISPDGVFCYRHHAFEASPSHDVKKSVEVVISNSGEADLRVDSVYFEEGGNDFVTLEWKFPKGPEALEPDGWILSPENESDVIRLLVVYKCAAGKVDMRHTTLVIKSNDPKFKEAPYNGEARFLFTVKGKGPEIRVDKKEITFACVTTSSKEDVYVDNVGTDTLIVSKIDFAYPSTEFSLVNTPVLPLEIPPLGDPGYKRMMFSVRYDPGDSNYDDANELEIWTNDLTKESGKLVVPVRVKQSPAIVEYSTDSPFAYFDFSEQSVHELVIYNKAASECDAYCPNKGQCCGCAFMLKKEIRYEPPDLSDWYKVTAKDPTTNEVKTLPLALKGGQAIKFEIKYEKPIGESGDKNGQICFPYEAPILGASEKCFAVMAVSQCQLSISPSTYQLWFNSTSPSDVKEKPLVLVNSGTAPCTLLGVEVTNKWGNGPSEDFQLKDIVPEGTQVPALSLFPIWVQYTPHATQPPLQGKLNVSYVDETVGPITETISLDGYLEKECTIPVADPGDTSDYSYARAGENVTLNGCNSHPGDCGPEVWDDGYLWYLVSKPAGSASELDIEGKCMILFTPDLPGTYVIALDVFATEGGKPPFYHSDTALLELEVMPAAE